MNYHKLLIATVAVALPACNGARTPHIGSEGLGRTSYLESIGGNSNSASRSGGSGPVDTVSYWDGSAGNGSPSIKIDLSEQKAMFYKGGTLVGISQISSGRESHRTPTGTFSIMQKNADHASNLYGTWEDSNGNVINDDVDVRKQPTPPPGARYVGAPMPNFMRLTGGGVGMHAGYLPGFPASHGCIRMPEHMSRHFFENVSIGTPVTVTH